jgi:hypothetical protein
VTQEAGGIARKSRHYTRDVQSDVQSDKKLFSTVCRSEYMQARIGLKSNLIDLPHVKPTCKLLFIYGMTVSLYFAGQPDK